MKPSYRSALIEAAMITIVAASLGFAYTGFTGKGLFSSSPTHGAASTADTTTPPRITFEQARDLFLSGSAFFIDARHEYDFSLGHIKGAVAIPPQGFDGTHPALEGLPKDNLIVTYCDGADCDSSIELAKKLSAAGYTNVRVFFGGWNEWLAHKQPTEP